MDVQDSQLKPGPRYREGAAYSVRAALFDVDNTLVGNESPELPSARFRAAVQAARGKIAVGLATARPLSKVAHILDYIGAEGLSILCNGAQIINNADRSVVAEWAMGPKTCEDAAAYVRALGVAHWINDGGVDYFGSAGGYEKQPDIWDQQSAKIPVPDYRPAKPFVLVAHHVTGPQSAEILRFVREYGDDRITVSVAHESKQSDGSTLYDVFVTHKQANKKHALHEVAHRQGLTTGEIMVVGDGRNDAVIVGEAGAGVAMGNATQETLAVATFITPDRESDGAAAALEFALINLTP